MLRKRSALKADVRHVMKNLSAVSASELRTARASVENTSRSMATLLKTHGGVAILDRAEPIAILIFQPTRDPKLMSTAFMATEKFFGAAWKPTRFLRRFLDQKMEAMPGVSLRSTTFSTHPELARWFRLMGYGEPQVEGSSYTFFRRPADLVARQPSVPS
jgi:hypothetical protein